MGKTAKGHGASSINQPRGHGQLIQLCPSLKSHVEQLQTGDNRVNPSSFIVLGPFVTAKGPVFSAEVEPRSGEESTQPQYARFGNVGKRRTINHVQMSEPALAPFPPRISHEF